MFPPQSVSVNLHLDEELYEQSAKTVRKTRKTLREKNVPENYPS